MSLDTFSDDSIPVVISARWRLVDRVVRKYGYEAILGIDEDLDPLDSHKFEIVVRFPDDIADRLTWYITNPRTFHRGLELCQSFLEFKAKLGYSLQSALKLADGASVSGGSNSPIGPTE